MACALAAQLLLAGPSPLAGQKTDVVKLLSGDTITGEIKSLSRGKLELSTDDAGTAQIEWDKIARLYSRHFFEVETETGAKFYGTLPESAEDGRMVVFLTAQDTLRLERVVLITPIKATFWERTRGNIDLGFNLTRANAQVEWTLGAGFKYRGQKWDADVKGNSFFRFQEGDLNTSRNDLTFSMRRFLKRRNSALAIGKLEQNQELDLALRTYVGLGGSRELILSNRLTLNGALGVLAIREQFTTSDLATYGAEFFLGGRFEAFRFDSPKLDLSIDPVGYVSITQFGRFRANVSARLRYEVFKDFYIGVQGFYTGDSDPPDPGTPKDDYAFNMTLGWSWS